MRGIVPGEFIEEVLNRTDIVALIAEYVRLAKKGQRYVGLCPFHQDRSPSFTVSPEKQFFYCFGCGTGGDALKFLMLRENLTFPEALERLADRAGLRLPEIRGDAAAQRRRQEREQAWRINKTAAEFFARQLRESAGEPARLYLEKRGIPLAVASKFDLGFASQSRDGLLRFMRGKGISGEEVLRFGLAVRLESGELIDRFRGRLIFPISDARGRVAGFGGRALDDSTMPKYLNSPETPFFNKRELLFALFQARQAIHETGFSVIVEGYLDALTAHQFGFCNVVASLGTSLTREQARLLLRHTSTVFIAYDSDAAGNAATLRGLDILQEAGFQVWVVSLPRGKDPDEFIRGAGPGAWENVVAGALPLIEYKTIHLAGKGIDTAARKMAVLRAVVPNLAALPTAAEREEGIRTVARVTGLNWEAVRDELDRFLGNGQKTWLKTSKTAKNKHKVKNTTDAREKAEAGILRILLEEPGLLARVGEGASSELFSQAQYRRIYLALRETAAVEGLRLPVLFSRLEEEDKSVVAALLSEQVPEDAEALLRDLINVIQVRERRKRRQELLLELSAAERAGDVQLTRELLYRISALIMNGKEGC
ncbi:MAG TPA: DNA primase [Desulfotomaculum sp.]|nr:DNA primase [Desulfotomaculum sp.]